MHTIGLLDTLPTGAMIISQEDHVNYLTVYFQSIEKARPDIIHFHRTYLFAPEYLSLRNPSLDVSALDGTPDSYNRFLRGNSENHRAFWEHGYEQPGLIDTSKLLPWGRLTKSVPEKSKDINQVEANSEKLLEKVYSPILASPQFGTEDFTAIEITSRFYSTRAKFYYDLGQHELCKKYLDKALLIRPDYPPLYLQVGSYFGSIGKYEKAIEAVDKGLLLDRLSAPLWAAKGNLLWHAGQKEQAVKAYEESLAINIAQPDTAGWLASYYYDKGDFDKVIKTARPTLALVTDPKRAERLLELYAFALIKQDDCDKANGPLMQLKKIRPDDEKLTEIIGHCSRSGR